MAEPWNKLDAELADTIEFRKVKQASAERFRCNPDEAAEVDDEGYELDDPKRSTYQSRMSDWWDMRDRDA